MPDTDGFVHLAPVSHPLQEAALSSAVEALDREIGGRAVDVPPQASTIGGDAVFAVIIALDDQLPRLRWA